METTDRTLVDLRAEVAMRAADSRIAARHMAQAAERIMTPENRRAYLGAERWFHVCKEAERQARKRLIGYGR